MHDEDRGHALDLYSDIFDEIGNDNAVLQVLVSPTRQAVNIARSYDAKERLYRAGSGEIASYEMVIENIRHQVMESVTPVSGLQADQLSLFSNPLFSEADEPAAEVPAAAAAPDTGFFPDEDPADAGPAPAPVPAFPAEAAEESAEEPASDAGAASDAVDAFLADFSIRDPEELPAQDRVPEPDTETAETFPYADRPEMESGFFWSFPDEDSAAAPQEPAPQPQPEPVTEPEPAPRSSFEMPSASRSAPAPAPSEEAERVSSRRVPVIPVMILFILAAVPLGLAAIGLLVLLALLVTGCSAAVLFASINGMICSFSFAVFSDILLVFGLSLAFTAIGLLLLWVAAWLLFGLIPALVRGVLSAGNSLCFKEVAA